MALRSTSRCCSLLFGIGLLFAAFAASAQETRLAEAGHEHHQHSGTPPSKAQKAKTPSVKKKKAPAHQHKQSGGGEPAAADHSGHSSTLHEHGGMAMKGFLGPYPINREASGTSWQPDTSPHEGVHAALGDWMVMWHALLNGVYDNQGGARGDQKAFASGMVMGMAQRQLGDGTLGFRAMVSPDPFMGARGYPLLFAAGETADGRTLLVDRQHPHDLFMELAGSYSYNVSANSSIYIYAGLPGEPALGPPAFMHRTSGMDNPEAPISHHWLDSTHITFGVVTLGAVVDNWKIEGSAFRGREPDQHRFDIEAPRLDSVSARLTWNPIRELSAQVSWGRIHSPEQLEPEVDEDRITASLIYTQPFGDNNLWSSTLAWGRKITRPGDTFDAFLVESALILQKRYTLFLRAERIDTHELLHDLPDVDPVLAHARFPVFKLSVGGIYDIPVADHVKFGIGALVSKYGVPDGLTPFYGSDPTSYMVFLRLKVS
jgi:hypothetical protein